MAFAVGGQPWIIYYVQAAVNIEVDSEVACTLLGDTFRPTWPKQPPAQHKPDVRLRSWSGETLTSCSQNRFSSSLEEAAARVIPDRALTSCTLYISPSTNFNLRELHTFILQLPPSFLLLGDFNAPHPLWGSAQADSRGSEVGRFLLSSISAFKMTTSLRLLAPGIARLHTFTCPFHHQL